MSKYLLEIGCEEIPARFIPEFLKSLADGLESAFSELGVLEAGYSVRRLSTYRRLVVVFDGVLAVQPDREEQIFGPPLAIAKDGEGNWTGAALGFAKKVGVAVGDLNSREDDKGRAVLFAQKHVKGLKLVDVLKGVVEGVVGKLALPIAMHWGAGEGVFIRPVHWVVSLFDREVVPLEIFGVQAGNRSRGHRFLSENSEDVSSGAWIAIDDVSRFEDLLEKAFVMVDQDRRREKIEAVLKGEMDVGAFDSKLLDEVVQLVEWPEILVGQFEDRFLSLPEEVLVQCMQKHQKYFPVFQNGALDGRFVVVADSVTDANRDMILTGNQTVLGARLADVAFFWDQDLKRSVDEMNQGLTRVVFQEGLGTIADKVGRLVCLSADLAKAWILSESEIREAVRVAELSKFDLVSEMVGELPALQGVMGRYYAISAGESESVSRGIQDQYDMGESVLGQVVGVADRLDNMVACFENGLIPTGSKDPWGIRQSIYAILHVLVMNERSFDVCGFLDLVYEKLGKLPDHREALEAFFRERARQFFLDKGYSHDLVEMVISGLMNPYEQLQILERVSRFRESDGDGFKLIVETAVRVARLARKGDDASVDEGLFEHDVEGEVFQQLMSISDDLVLLKTFSELMSRYFDAVLVMAEDVRVKANRLAVLKQVNEVFSRVGDFEKVVL